MTSPLGLISIALALMGVLLIIPGFIRIYKRRPLAGLALQVPGLLSLALAAVLMIMASSLHVYQRLDHESPVAEIMFIQTGEKAYSVELKDIGLDEINYYDLAGDEWQLDAQIQIWHSYANLLGLDTRYRLYRLSGRYTDIDQERTSPRSVHALYTKDSFDVLGSFDLPDTWLSWLVDTTYGNAVFLPMTDRALYQVSISQKGLVVRPGNAQAKKAISRWIGL